MLLRRLLRECRTGKGTWRGEMNIRTHTEETVYDEYPMEKEERTTENNMEKMQSNGTWKTSGLRATEVMDRATKGKTRGMKNKKSQLQGPCLTSGIWVPWRRFIYNILTYWYDCGIWKMADVIQFWEMQMSTHRTGKYKHELWNGRDYFKYNRERKRLRSNNGCEHESLRTMQNCSV